jgi:signal transduction histidine kinase
VATAPEPVCAVLREMDLFADVAPDALRAFAAQAQEVRLDAGEVLVEPGVPQTHVHVLVEGVLEWAQRVGDEWVVMNVHRPVTSNGAIGALVEITAELRARALEPSRLWAWDHPTFVALVRADELLLRKVARMLTEVTTGNEATRQQRDKLASLGTLAAGLAHEINNPAAAAQRAAAELRRALEAVLADAPAAPVLTTGTAGDDPLAAADREDELGRWLEDRDVPAAWELAADLADGGLDAAWAAGAGGEATGPALGTLLRAAATGASARRLLDKLEEGLRRIGTLVGAIREYSHVDRAPEADVDVHDGLEATLTILGHKLRDRGTTVVRELDRGLPRIAAYPSELNQVWTNLVANAVDAAPGGTVTLRTRALPGGEAVEVEVADDGAGIPADVLPRIFEPFFTTKGTGSGTGLGLDIARRIVRVRHGGDLSVTSAPGDTRFVVRLPVSRR